MSFVAFAQSHGVLIRDLRSDGRIHRVPTSSHPRKRNGAYKFTGEWGWVQDWSEHAEPIVFKPDHIPHEIVRRDMAKERKAERERRDRAAMQAQEVVQRCRFDHHPYLDRKGFKDEQGLVDYDGRLVIPMRAVGRYQRVNSVQWIASDGTKKFLPGGAAKGSALVIGTGPEQWLCEGYATALSLRAALASLYRQARIVVCFSAGNLAAVAGLLTGRRFVMADNDASGTGARYAAATGLPWAMPPNVGMDANDMHAALGVRALAELMREVATRT